MEKEGRSTKFCLICNYVSRIIEPLTSRCAKFRFKPLARDVLIARLELISKEENIEVSDDAMEALLMTSEGDLRKAITSLQSCARLKSGSDKAITKEDVYELSGVVPEKWLDGLMEACKSNSFERVQSFVDELMCEGYSVAQLFSQVHDQVVASETFSDRQKSDICEALAVNESRLLDGANEYLQLMDLASIMLKTMAKGA